MRARRWSDNDRYLGPFTYARERNDYKRLAMVLSSAGDEDRGCEFRISGFGHTFITALPNIIKPWRRWVDTSKYEWSKNPNGGYWDIHRREYGFCFSRSGSIGDSTFLQVFLGAQTHDSSTTQSWCKSLPWTSWRHVRRSLYDLHGTHVWTEPESLGYNHDAYVTRKAAEEGCPSRTFAFTDYDGEQLTARTRIEESEWRFGTGWFKWLSVFRKPIIHRSLDIRFSGETGKRKGSWKGGTIGHALNMLPGELHESAFRRYCDEHQMTFIGSSLEAAE